VGNAGGNPHVKKMAQYKRALMDAGSDERVKSVTDSLFAAATAASPDIAAAKLLLDHWCGRPTQSIEVSGPDGDNVRLDVANMASVIMIALKDHPEARYKVATALRQIGQQEVQHDGPVDGNLTQG